MARNYRFFLRNPDTTRLLQKAVDVVRLDEDLEPEIVFQLVKVLRVKAGDLVTLLPQMESDGAGADFLEYDFEVGVANKNAVDLRPKGSRKNENELSFALNLWLCLPNKPEKLEMILQKAVEIGVRSVALFESDFSQMKHQLRMDRLEKIMTEAAEQSERAVVPQLETPGSLTKFLQSGDAGNLKNVFVAMERLDSEKVWSEKKDEAVNPFVGAKLAGGINVLVGPEGGFSDAEKKLFDEVGLQKFSLGKRILRMETAAILSLGLASLRDV